MKQLIIRFTKLALVEFFRRDTSTLNLSLSSENLVIGKY